MSAPFTDHRDACLALLNSRADIGRRAGGFVGQALFQDALSEKQVTWLAGLLHRAELPPLAGEVSRG
jgi:hypothetical protein